mgnify:CR=1 FL=1
MLSENIKAVRKSKGLSQQELAVKLNVVRQTVSKWEQGGSLIRYNKFRKLKSK